MSRARDKTAGAAPLAGEAAGQTLDVEFARRQFPGINDFLFFENAGGSLVPQTVIDRVTAYMSETQVQPGAAYGPSSLAAERMRQGHHLMAAMINADPDEVVIGPSTTNNVYVLSQAFAQWLEPGDEVIVTNLDHEANNGAWRRLEERGTVVREWQWNRETGGLDVAALESLLTERTRLVCFTHLSNVTGTINDVQAITARVHEADALVCVDAVAYAPHRHLDVRDTDVDFYLFSPYKLYGPHLGVLYGKREYQEVLPGQNHFFLKDPPLKISAGYPNHELTAALVGIGDYMTDLYRHHIGADPVDTHHCFQSMFDLFSKHEELLAARFVDFLVSKSPVRLVGLPRFERGLRAPTFSFTVENKDSHDLAAALAARGVGVGSGDFYARRCIESLALPPGQGVVRASMVHYNTLDEVDRLIEALDALI